MVLFVVQSTVCYRAPLETALTFTKCATSAPLAAVPGQNGLSSPSWYWFELADWLHRSIHQMCVICVLFWAAVTGVPCHIGVGHLTPFSHH